MQERGYARGGRLAWGALVVIGLLTVSGCGADVGVTGSAGQAASGSAPEVGAPSDSPLQQVPAPFGCGQAFVRPAQARQTMTGDFPDTVVGADRALSGTVTVRVDGGSVAGVASPQAEVFLVKDGRIVALPVPQDSVGMRLDLAVGDARRLPAPAALVPCELRSAGDVLAAGTYELYARVAVHGDDGAQTDFIGGPWSIQLR